MQPPAGGAHSPKPRGRAVVVVLQPMKAFPDAAFPEKAATLERIREKVLDGQRIDAAEGLVLYECADLSFLGALANAVRERKHRNHTYFNRNFHIEPTNLCIYTCSFCSYSRRIKKREEGWELSLEEMLDQVKAFDGQPVTEVHVVGGVTPRYDLDFYCDFFKAVKSHRPELHLKALTPVEYHYIFHKARVSYEEGLERVRDAGVDSLPGGGAEIFDEALRDQIAGGKCTSEQWLRIHEIWHGMGMRSNATMLYGHIEQYEHRIDHMQRLRELQDRTHGFQTFIPLKFRNKNNEMAHIEEVSLLDDMKNFAVARIFLDNFDHLKAYWPMLGRQYAQLALSFGVDDIDGTIDDTTRIYSMAGSEEQRPSLQTAELIHLIRQVGRIPVERDSLYHPLHIYDGDGPEPKTAIFKDSFFPLPVESASQ
ncbi:MAG: Aminodeoxyfutalosine synthase [Saprospiraceae bacterium]|jgi:aminodeoxyfutalosine synthase|nr:Aminodeoxyfutalosine synthase [Saprospiraceae bacterium]